MIFPINLKLVIKTEAEKADETDKNLQERTEDYTERHPHDTPFENLYAEEINTISKNCDTDENADIIKRRSERIKDETTDRLLDGVQNCGNTKEKRVNRDNAGHINRKNRSRLIEAWTDNIANQRICKNHNKNTSNKSH